MFKIDGKTIILFSMIRIGEFYLATKKLLILTEKYNSVSYIFSISLKIKYYDFVELRVL